jgi:hypothetical protein
MGTTDATADHDVVFWVGDLNYRINGNSRAVGYLLRSRLHEVLHANDQLRLQQKKGRVFQVRAPGAVAREWLAHMLSVRMWITSR